MDTSVEANDLPGYLLELRDLQDPDNDVFC